MKPLLELTTRFSGITTGAGARNQSRSGNDAVGAALAHLRYIARPKAAIEVAASGLPIADHRPDMVDRRTLRQALRERLERRAGSGGKVGRRIAEKMIVSLPVDWDQAARVDLMRRVVEHIAPAGSEAVAVAYSHGDKPGNPHFHLLAVDGVESREAARKRRPHALRVRRRDVIRLGDRGRPKQLRGEIARIINSVAQEHGLSGVEWRSFRDRGIFGRRPGQHDGPEKRARMSREGAPPSHPTRRRGPIARMADALSVQNAHHLQEEVPLSRRGHHNR